MQPDQQNNYWQPGEDNDSKSDIPSDMYAPEPDQDNTPNPSEQSDTVDESIDNVSVHWSAAEYISQEKDKIWYTFFGLVVIGLIAIDIFLLKEFTFSILVIVMAISLIVFSKRKPRTLNYTLTSDQGLYIDDKLYHFSEFRAFGLLKEHGQHTIMLIPTKRFAPGVSVYFPEESGERIVDILGNRLPMQELKLDLIDIIVQKIRL